MQTFIYLLFFGFSIFIIMKLVVQPEIELRKKIKKLNEQKKSSSSTEIKRDKNDPKKFLQKVQSNREKLKRGEMIGVDAARAFFLMRTSSHNAMIVSEDGTINMKDLSDIASLNSDSEELRDLQRDILEYQPANRDQAQVKKFQLPGYVKEVQQLKDGIVRWVYEDWHSEECGIKSICFDKHSRVTKDPETQPEDTKNKSPKKNNHKNEARDESVGRNNEIKDLSKKLSRVIEMQQELRVDHMLSLADEAKEVLASQDPSSNKSIVDAQQDKDDLDEEALLDLQESQKPKRSVKKETVLGLTPCEYKDEVDLLQEEIPLPNYFDLMSDDDAEKKDEDEFSAELERDILLSSENDVKQEEFRYEDEDSFLQSVATKDNFFEKVFELVCSEKENFGRILYDDEKRNIYLEKNFYFRCVANAISKSDKYKFEQDFMQRDAIEIYNGKKVGSIVQAMNSRNLFDQTEKSDFIFKMLFMSEERENVCYMGWFIKMPLGGYEPMDEFVNYYSESVTIISDKPREILRTSKRYTNVIVSY